MSVNSDLGRFSPEKSDPGRNLPIILTLGHFFPRPRDGKIPTLAGKIPTLAGQIPTLAGKIPTLGRENSDLLPRSLFPRSDLSAGGKVTFQDRKYR